MPRSAASYLGLHCLPMFNNQIPLLRRHTDITDAINNRYLDFVQMRGLIVLVNDKHVDNNF